MAVNILFFSTFWQGCLFGTCPAVKAKISHQEQLTYFLPIAKREDHDAAMKFTGAKVLNSSADDILGVLRVAMLISLGLRTETHGVQYGVKRSPCSCAVEKYVGPFEPLVVSGIYVIAIGNVLQIYRWQALQRRIDTHLFWSFDLNDTIHANHQIIEQIEKRKMFPLDSFVYFCSSRGSQS